MIRLEWILHPGAQYALLGAGLGLCLYLFFTLKVEAARLERRSRDKWAAMTEAAAALRDVVLNLRLAVGFYDGRQAVSLAWSGGPT